MKSTSLRNTIKIGLAGTSIAAIAALMIIVDTPDEIAQGEIVKPAEADVWDLNMSSVSKQKRFEESLKELGMSKPQSYLVNGNRLYFSHKSESRKSPDDLFMEFQETFKRNGVNKFMYAGPAKKSALQNVNPKTKRELVQSASAMMQFGEFFSGGLVPVENRRNSMQLVGVETKGKANGPIELYTEVKSTGRETPEELVDAVRFVEAFREEGGKTHVTAIWSDYGFSFKNFLPEHAARNPQSYNPDVPPCSRCKPLMNVVGEGESAGMTHGTYISEWNVEMTRDFYVKKMLHSGWKIDTSSYVGERMLKRYNPHAVNGVSLVFQRGARTATITINHDEDLDATLVKGMTVD